jgi:hypothetical protein
MTGHLDEVFKDLLKSDLSGLFGSCTPEVTVTVRTNADGLVDAAYGNNGTRTLSSGLPSESMKNA